MKSDIIKNIFITNFHHKKGCEIETIYPSNLKKSELNFWKYLPNLTLPDGAHHYSKGFVYFTLPNDIFDDSMLYGISCYKQVKSKDILNKSKEVTRSTVQKSLCILTTLPLFTYLKHKMYDALECYFDLKDITQIEFLTNLYNFLNISLSLEIQSDPNLVFKGLSATALFESFPPKFVLTIFKLLLLDYKVLFFGANPGLLTQIILAFLTLLPKFLEFDIRRYGLSSESSQDQLFQLNGVSSNDQKQREVIQNGGPDIETNVGFSIFYDDAKMANGGGPSKVGDGTKKVNSFKSYLHALEPTKLQSADPPVARSSFYVPQMETENSEYLTSQYQISGIFDQYGFPMAHYNVAEWFTDDKDIIHEVDDGNKGEMSFYCPYLSLPYLDLIREKSLDGSKISNCIVGASNVLFKQKANNIFDVIVDIDSHRMDFVDKNVASQSPGERKWRRDLSLTSADSRFIQYILRRIRLLTPPPQKVDPPAPNETKTPEVAECNEKNAECSRKEASESVTGERTFDQIGEIAENGEERQHVTITAILPGESVYLTKPSPDKSSLTVSPSGSSSASTPESLKGFGDEDGQNDDLDAWIRGQFKLYLISLLSTTRMSDSLYRPRYEEDFNPFFVDAFKKTRIYALWNSSPHPGISEVQAGHPFQGTLGIVDVKLRLSNAIANTDRGKKMFDEAALNAGKGLGFVWSSTKSALSTLFK